MAARRSSRVHRKYKTKYRIRNSREYERALRSRGDLTIWLSAEAVAAWTPPKNGLRGGQRRYADLAILTALTLRLVFRLPLRQTEGFLDSLLSWMGLDLKAPDHTTRSCRNQVVEVQPLTRAHDGPIDLIVDSTGLKILGCGAWNVHKHKSSKATPGLEEAAHRRGRGGIHCGGRTHAGQRGRRLNLAGSARPDRGSRPAGSRPTGPTTTGPATIGSARPEQRMS